MLSVSPVMQNPRRSASVFRVVLRNTDNLHIGKMRKQPEGSF